MAKSKEGREDEYYKGIIREQRSEIKRLKRKIRELEKENLLYEHDDEESIEREEKTKTCPKENCQGSLEYKTAVGRMWYGCTHCDYRTKAVKV